MKDHGKVELSTLTKVLLERQPKCLFVNFGVVDAYFVRIYLKCI